MIDREPFRDRDLAWASMGSKHFQGKMLEVLKVTGYPGSPWVSHPPGERLAQRRRETRRWGAILKAGPGHIGKTSHKSLNLWHPQGKQSFQSWKEAPEGSWGKLWLTAQWSDSDIPKSTRVYESAELKDKYIAFHLGIWLKHSGKEKERGSEQGSRLRCRGSSPYPLPTAQAPMAQLAFLLGLTMILIWPQMKRKRKKKSI